MATPVTTTVKLTNFGGATATLASSTYQPAPPTINNGSVLATFDQKLLTNTPGAVVYGIGNVATWIVSWTADNEVATRILPAGIPVFWTDTWDTLQPKHAEHSVSMAGVEYVSIADVSSEGGAQTLNAIIESSRFG
ncbi:hypothetical protein V6N13_149486 [Hibiscus sabdariffa]|uniref:Uncharacterized protein n=1 Tax=Hibiscus sabdariffa TaxID=183260 RepID=A0ABR2EH80_9ROSI